MRGKLLATAGVVCILLWAGCPPAPRNQAPTVALNAEPGSGPPPLLAIIDANATDPDGDDLTYSWTLDSVSLPDEALERMAWSFESAGTYQFGVSVSDGEFTVSDTVDVTVASAPSTSKTIGSAGGDVSLETCTLDVPASVAPEDCLFTLTKLPSMQPDAKNNLKSLSFAAIGDAYTIDTPLKCADPMSLEFAYTAGDIPAGYDDTHLALMRRLPSLPEIAEDAGDEDRLPYMEYVLLPATKPETGVAAMDLYGRGDFQLVAMSEALYTTTLPISKWQPKGHPKPSPVPNVTVHFMNQPANRAAYINALDAGIQQAHQVYVVTKGFPAPTGHLTINVKNLGNTLGSVAFNTCNTITMHSGITSTNTIKKTVAHEYFHNIQMFASNYASLNAYWWEEDWYFEGTASWAMDEAYDTIQGGYHATPWKRLRAPLNKLPGKSLDSYQTVVFWKWAEAKMPNILAQGIVIHQFQTHSFTGSAFIENSSQVKFSDSFHSLWPNLNYLAFVADAAYYKDFELDETRMYEIWDNDKLNTPRYVNGNDSDWSLLKPNNPGDGKDNKLDVDFALKQHLSCDIRMIQAQNLSGTLHIKFPQKTEPIRATVIVHNFSEEKTVTNTIDLNASEYEFTAKFEQGYEAVIIIGDPRWQYDSSHTAITGTMKVWIESPCLSTPGSVTDVTNTIELVNALETVSAGNTIRLAAGTYTPAIQEWPRLWDAPANMGIDGQTLLGAGKESTIIELYGADGGIVAHGSTSIRNLTIEVLNTGGGIALIGMGIDNLELCNTDILVTAPNYDGISFEPWETPGAHSFTMYNSSLVGRGPTTSGTNYFGFEPTSFYASDVFTIHIENSMISGWDYALNYYNGCDDSGTMNVTYDCSNFSNNDRNVTAGACYTSENICYCNFTEQCPNP